MTELMRVLYQYSSKIQVPCDAEDYAQYSESTQSAQRNLEALRGQLAPETLQKLENYLAEQRVLHDLELETVFRTGFSIGQELSRV